MNTKPKAIGQDRRRHREVSGLLSDILLLRSQGLLTQTEYEERLGEIQRGLPSAQHLSEFDLVRGGTMFVLREAGSRRIVAQFEFPRGHEVAL